MGSRLRTIDKDCLNEDSRDRNKHSLEGVLCLKETLVFESYAESKKESSNTLKLCLQ